MYVIKSQSHLEEVSRTPLTAPNVDIATNTGMVQANQPNTRSANNCGNKKINNI